MISGCATKTVALFAGYVRSETPPPTGDRAGERDASGSARVLAYDEYGRRQLAGGQAQL
jgi:hypothetical protein